MFVLTPHTLFLFTISSTTISCQKSMFFNFSSSILHISAKRILSLWHLGLHMAGPFDLLSILNCTIVWSEIMPERPPNASTSLTICPFAIPPIAGLHDICAIVCIFIVISKTFFFIFAAIAAASHPACPPPTIIMSYVPLYILQI